MNTHVFCYLLKEPFIGAREVKLCWSFQEVSWLLEYGSCCSGDCAQVCHRRVVAEYRLRIDKQERVSTFKAQVAAKALWIDTPPPPPYLSLIICNDS